MATILLRHLLTPRLINLRGSKCSLESSFYAAQSIRTLLTQSYRTSPKTTLNVMRPVTSSCSASFTKIACHEINVFSTVRWQSKGLRQQFDSQLTKVALIASGRQTLWKNIAVIGATILAVSSARSCAIDEGRSGGRIVNSAACDTLDEEDLKFSVMPVCLILKWLKLFLLVYRVAVLKDIDDPIILSVNALIIILALYNDNPKPESVWTWIQARTILRESNENIFIDILNSVKDAASKSAALFNHVDVDNYGLFSIATVRSIHSSELILLGFLGEWWLIHESYYDALVRVTRSTPLLLVEDFMNSWKQLLESLYESSLFRSVSHHLENIHL